jgi:HEAT repeat protein
MHARLLTGWTLVCLAAACAAGCTSFKLPWSKPKKPVAECARIAPGDQVLMLQKIAEEASGKSPEDQQRLSNRLVELLHNESDPVLRSEILHTLREFRTPAAEEALRGGLKDSDSSVRVRACALLAKRLDPPAVTALAEALTGDVDHDVRIAAARALSGAHDPAAVRALGLALDDADPAMQYRAVASLQESTGKDLGNDVERWRHYVKGEPLPPAHPVSLAERFWQMF